MLTFEEFEKIAAGVPLLDPAALKRIYNLYAAAARKNYKSGLLTRPQLLKEYANIGREGLGELSSHGVHSKRLQRLLDSATKAQGSIKGAAADSMPAIPDVYAIGFIDKCAELGIDAEELLAKVSSGCGGSKPKKKAKKK